MPTYFQDFTRDDGLPITVEYSAHGGERNIVARWPNTAEYNGLCNQRHALVNGHYPPIAPVSEVELKEIAELDKKIDVLERACNLTDAELDRMEAWLAEHHVIESDNFDF